MSKPVRFMAGKQVYLRPISVEDTELYFQMMFHPETRRLTGTQRVFTREQIRGYLESKTQDTSGLLLLIALRETDEVIGDIQLLGVDATNRNASIRIAVNAENQRGKGYGSEAMLLLLDHAFGVMNLHRVELNVFAFNDRAKRVYEKLGFQVEGVQREALFYNHEYHDSINMAILAREYRALHKPSLT